MIGIVTVLYNSSSVIEEFMLTLNQQTIKAIILYIVNNKSPDDSLDKARVLSKQVDYRCVFINNSENFGIARGNNQGIKEAILEKCDYILLSNNDVVLLPSTIENLYKQLISKNMNIAVPKIYYYGTNKIWAAGGYFNLKYGSTRHYGSLDEDRGQFNTMKMISYAPTCFMLLEKKVFELIGYMNEDYFVYYDDTDFMYRAYKNNIKTFYIPESIVYHKESTSTGKCSMFQAFYLSRNSLLFAFNNFSILYFIYVILLRSLIHLFKHPFLYKFKVWNQERRGLYSGIKLCYTKYRKK